MVFFKKYFKKYLKKAYYLFLGNKVYFYNQNDFYFSMETFFLSRKKKVTTFN